MPNGIVRGEALYTPRGCWFVCYPSPSTKHRLTNFKQEELALAERTLKLFRTLADHALQDRESLMVAGCTARSLLRNDPKATDDEVLGAALAALGRAKASLGEDVEPEDAIVLEDCVREDNTREDDALEDDTREDDALVDDTRGWGCSADRTRRRWHH